MKKFTAMMVLVILTMMSLVGAHGEMHFATAKWDEEKNYVTDSDGTEHYYVYVTRDGFDYTSVREVSRTMYYELLAEEQRDQEKAENAWYNKAWKWTKGAALDVADFVTFWN